MSGGVQIKAGDVIAALTKRWKTVAAMGVAGLVLGGVMTALNYANGNVNGYEIKTSFAVTSQSDGGTFTGGSAYMNPSDFYLAQDMVNAVEYVMGSGSTLGAVVKAAKASSVTAEDVSSALSFEQYAETVVVEATLKWNDGNQGLAIMDALLDESAKRLPKTLKTGTVSVIDEPAIVDAKAGGAPSMLWALMAIVGAAAGVGLTTLDLVINPKLTDPRDADALFGVETLGVIPKSQAFANRTAGLLETPPPADVARNFASAAYILENRMSGEEFPRAFYVTSAGRGEGKATTAAMLALKLSEMGRKTLLVDFDTADPSLGRLFLKTVDYRKTVNAVYYGKSTPEKAIDKLTGTLDLLPCLLECTPLPVAGALAEFLRESKSRYEYVIVNAAPVGASSDALSLNGATDGAVLAIGLDSAPVADVQDAVAKLDKSGVRILGCVIGRPEKKRGNARRATEWTGADDPSAEPMAKPEKAAKKAKGKAKKAPVAETGFTARKAGVIGFDDADAPAGRDVEAMDEMTRGV